MSGEQIDPLAPSSCAFGPTGERLCRRTGCSMPVWCCHRTDTVMAVCEKGMSE